MPVAPFQRLYFGSALERRLIPHHYPPNRLGNQVARQDAPHVGPGRYDNHEYGTILYNIQKTPESKRGYGLNARTAVRFPPCGKQTVTPSPQHYQQDQSRSRVPPPSKTPFNSNTQRFKHKSRTVEDSPGPGSYAHDAVTNRKVSWPMRFGSPDWSKLPQTEKSSQGLKMNNDKDFQKKRSRLAYLSLYY